MAHASGSHLYMTFGAVVLTGDQRSVSWDDTNSFADTTAGADPATSQVPTTYSVTGSIDFVDNGTDSSTLKKAIYPGARGTLTWGPRGTASGEPKYSLVVDIEGNSHTIDFGSEQMVSMNWRNQGTWIENYDRGLGAGTWGA